MPIYKDGYSTYSIEGLEVKTSPRSQTITIEGVTREVARYGELCQYLYLVENTAEYKSKDWRNDIERFLN
jgi:hypothetical protein